MIKRLTHIFIIVLFYNSNTFAQQLNLTQFDDKPFHFGFALSINQSSYALNKNNTYYFKTDPNMPNADMFSPNDTLLSSMIVSPGSGFTLGVISSININPNFKIRFAIPSLSFQECTLTYSYLNPVTKELLYDQVKEIRPVYLNFPAMIKFRSDRIDNWAVYGITGIRFGLDMSSNSEVVNSDLSLDEQVVKLKKTDFGFELGGGFDFFLQYFKLGLELKLGLGMNNIHQNDNNFFDQPINGLKSRVWTFSLTFEG